MSSSEQNPPTFADLLVSIPARERAGGRAANRLTFQQTWGYNRPNDAQMIVGLVDDLSIPLGGDVIELTEPRQLLQKQQYETVAERIRPFLNDRAQFCASG